MERTRSVVGFWLLCLLSPWLRADGQAVAVPQPPTFAHDLQALTAATVGKSHVVLTVSPERVTPVPPPDAAAVPPPETASPDGTVPDSFSPSLEDVATRYGRLENWFGHVCALAPPTMTLLNTSPALADLPLGELVGQHPETYLLGSLTPEQLRQAGATGLSYADMTPDQQSLIRALLPEPLEIVPASATLPDRNMDESDRAAKRAEFDARIQKVSGEALFGALRLHAYLTADFYVHAPSGYGIGDTRGLSETTGAFKLPFSGYSNMEARGKATETILRADVPNAPKPGDLAWDRHELRPTVSLLGLRTVDDLTARLARATGLELYADTRYGPQSLLAWGDLGTPQTAGDVMQALALCVCGTWRRVGPAYVLADDVQGLGARQEFLTEIGQVWSNRLSQAGKDAGARLRARDWLHSLSFAPGDLGALTDGQVNAVQKQNGGNKGDLPWKDLPPSLQDHLRDQFLHYGDDMPASFPEIVKMGADMKAAARSVRPDTPVETTINIRLAVELPNTGSMMLYGDYRVENPDVPSNGAKADAATGSKITLSGPLRAVLCAPRTPEEARAVVAKLPTMGFNALYLDVFTGGRTFFPNTALQPDSDREAGVLQAALDAAGPLHIPVSAVLDTFCWRKGGLAPRPQPWPSGYGEDLTVSGETPDRAIQRRVDAGSLSADYDHPRLALAGEGARGWASPLDARVRALLPALVGTLAQTKGLAGLIFQDTVPPGYSEGSFAGDQIGLGYTPESRLAYLRRMHQDPVDLSVGFDMVSVFVGGEFFFGHYSIAIPTFPSVPEDYAAWAKYRAGADRSLLTGCRRSAQAAAPSLPLFRREGLSGGSFVPWVRADQAVAPAMPLAAGLRRITLRDTLGVAFGPDDQAHPERFLQSARAAGKAGGIVFDLTAVGTPSGLAETLDRLGSFLEKPKGAVASGDTSAQEHDSSPLLK